MRMGFLSQPAGEGVGYPEVFFLFSFFGNPRRNLTIKKPKPDSPVHASLPCKQKTDF